MKRFFMKRYAWAAAFGIILSLFMTYVMLDTFVFPREMEPIAVNKAFAESMATEADTPAHDTVQTENYYSDGDIEITIDKSRFYDTDVYTANILITDPSYLKTAFAHDKCGVHITEKISSISERVGSILSINGDYFGFRSEGFVMRSGVLYRASSSGYEALIINVDGTFNFVPEDSTDAVSLVDKARDMLSFGPALIKNGILTVTENDIIVREYIEGSSNPRTAIGIVSPGHYVFVVSDGRTERSAGLSLYQLGLKMKELGCTDAYNLDGGGSSEMWFCGKVVNNPTGDGSEIKEREVSDIVYIGR